MSKEKILIDSKVPRRAYYHNTASRPGPCPQCGGTIFPSTQAYLVATREGKRLTDSFIIGGDFGRYCPTCPPVSPRDW